MTQPSPIHPPRRLKVPTVEIELADGHPWGFALPAPRLYPVIIPTAEALGVHRSRIESIVRVGYPLAVRRRLDDLLNACRDDDTNQPSLAFVKLATHLLQVTNDLSAEDAARLLHPDHIDLTRVAQALIPAILAVFPQGSS